MKITKDSILVHYRNLKNNRFSLSCHNTTIYFCTHLLWALPPPQLGEHMIYYQEENILRVKVTAIDLVQETVYEMALPANCMCSYPIHALLLVGLGLEPR